MRTLTSSFSGGECHNPSLGLTTKARACKGVNQEGSSRITFHALASVRECEGMNPHTPKWAPILGIGVPMDSQIFIKQLQGSKPIGLKSSLYHWKSLRTWMSKMGSHDPFRHLKYKLWPKEGLGVKLVIYTPLPLKCCELGSATQLLLLSLFSPLDSHLSPLRSLGVCHPA
jgi:hypothetical protein